MLRFKCLIFISLHTPQNMVVDQWSFNFFLKTSGPGAFRKIDSIVNLWQNLGTFGRWLRHGHRWVYNKDNDPNIQWNQHRNVCGNRKSVFCNDHYSLQIWTHLKTDGLSEGKQFKGTNLRMYKCLKYSEWRINTRSSTSISYCVRHCSFSAVILSSSSY